MQEIKIVIMVWVFGKSFFLFFFFFMAVHSSLKSLQDFRVMFLDNRLYLQIL